MCPEINHAITQIINSSVFTQTIGDAEAFGYLATLVYTLTENPKYKYIHVNFEEGDHGGTPGLKGRKDFTNYKICK